MNEHPDDQSIFEEGKRCGEQPNCLAADCSYLPPGELRERGIWMDGFSAGRATLDMDDFEPVKKAIYEPHAG